MVQVRYSSFVVRNSMYLLQSCVLIYGIRSIYFLCDDIYKVNWGAPYARSMKPVWTREAIAIQNCHDNHPSASMRTGRRTRPLRFPLARYPPHSHVIHLLSKLSCTGTTPLQRKHICSEALPRYSRTNSESRTK